MIFLCAGNERLYDVISERPRWNLYKLATQEQLIEWQLTSRTP